MSIFNQKNRIVSAQVAYAGKINHARTRTKCVLLAVVPSARCRPSPLERIGGERSEPPQDRQDGREEINTDPEKARPTSDCVICARLIIIALGECGEPVCSQSRWARSRLCGLCEVRGPAFTAWAGSQNPGSLLLRPARARDHPGNPVTQSATSTDHYPHESGAHADLSKGFDCERKGRIQDKDGTGLKSGPGGDSLGAAGWAVRKKAPAN